MLTLLFTDIEGSTRLWEQAPDRMSPALARHDALARAAVESNRGVVVKMVGDGLLAAFADPLDALNATLGLQESLIDAGATSGVALHVRCGLHAGTVERRDNDFFGSAVNRAARIMVAAHGGQVLLSQAVAALIGDHLPPRVTLLDLGFVHLRDLASPEHIYQVAHPKLRKDFPALRSLEATPNNLPQQVSTFIGRDREVTEIRMLLGRNRLLTLLGVGGIGKTRLSLQVAADVIDDYPDGVWFVELAPLPDPRLVPQAVASVLGVKEDAGRPVVEALLMHVKNRQLLIILDNCEHLVDACAELTKSLLQSGPFLKILATSREHLHVAGEASYPVPPLPIPDPQETIALASLTKYEGAQLFIDRAIAARPSFQATLQNAAAIADICHRLDGIPLAIELAAARVRAMSVADIAAHLNDRFRLLGGGDRTGLPRQQTLRASIGWSYDLLTEPERALLRRLAVFAGGWTLEAAEAVGAGGETKGSDVVDLLTCLVEKSLVEWEADRERYRLLETVRQYALERLDAADERNEAGGRHLAFYLALAEKAMPEARGPRQGAWLARLDLERENLLSAHAWCDRPQVEAELGLRLVFAVAGYWLPRGLLELGHRVTLEALARSGAQEPNLARCRGLSAAGFIAFFMGRYAQAQGYLEESLGIAREIGHEERIANALRLLGLVSRAQGERTTARCHLEASLALARQLEHKGQLYAGLTALAELNRAEGNLDAAEMLYEESLTLARASGDRVYGVDCLSNLAALSIGRGLTSRARGMLLAALAIVEEIGWKNEGQSVLEHAAALAACLGEWKPAVRFFGAAEAQRERTGARRDPVDETFLTPLIAKTREALGVAAFAPAEAAGRALSYEEAIAEVHAWLQSRS